MEGLFLETSAADGATAAALPCHCFIFQSCLLFYKVQCCCYIVTKLTRPKLIIIAIDHEFCLNDNRNMMM